MKTVDQQTHVLKKQSHELLTIKALGGETGNANPASMKNSGGKSCKSPGNGYESAVLANLQNLSEISPMTQTLHPTKASFLLFVCLVE